ncbi:hypothetical protein U1Q18_000420, partial [Sarracenia purpurea var. burkii]
KRRERIVDALDFVTTAISIAELQPLSRVVLVCGPSPPACISEELRIEFRWSPLLKPISKVRARICLVLAQILF